MGNGITSSFKKSDTITQNKILNLLVGKDDKKSVKAFRAICKDDSIMLQALDIITKAYKNTNEESYVRRVENIGKILKKAFAGDLPLPTTQVPSEQSIVHSSSIRRETHTL